MTVHHAETGMEYSHGRWYKHGRVQPWNINTRCEVTAARNRVAKAKRNKTRHMGRQS